MSSPGRDLRIQGLGGGFSAPREGRRHVSRRRREEQAGALPTCLCVGIDLGTRHEDTDLNAAPSC